MNSVRSSNSALCVLVVNESFCMATAGCMPTCNCAPDSLFPLAWNSVM